VKGYQYLYLYLYFYLKCVVFPSVYKKFRMCLAPPLFHRVMCVLFMFFSFVFLQCTIDTEGWARTIRALLLRAGVEPNPGPVVHLAALRISRPRARPNMVIPEWYPCPQESVLRQDPRHAIDALESTAVAVSPPRVLSASPVPVTPEQGPGVMCYAPLRQFPCADEDDTPLRAPSRESLASPDPATPLTYPGFTRATPLRRRSRLHADGMGPRHSTPEPQCLPNALTLTRASAAIEALAPWLLVARARSRGQLRVRAHCGQRTVVDFELVRPHPVATFRRRDGSRQCCWLADFLPVRDSERPYRTLLPWPSKKPPCTFHEAFDWFDDWPDLVIGVLRLDPTPAHGASYVELRDVAPVVSESAAARRARSQSPVAIAPRCMFWCDRPPSVSPPSSPPAIAKYLREEKLVGGNQATKSG
jgi:hypothetical protein